MRRAKTGAFAQGDGSKQNPSWRRTLLKPTSIGAARFDQPTTNLGTRTSSRSRGGFRGLVLLRGSRDPVVDPAASGPQGADTLNPDLDGESRDWMGESQSQQCGVGSLDHCKAFSMDATHSAATLCCDAPSSRTNQIRSHWAMRFLCHPLRLDGHWMAGISRAADDSC